MSFFDEIEKHFNKRDLYEVLELSKENFTEKLLRKSYFKLSRDFHPDRCQDNNKKEEYTKKFQIISKVYSLLSDKESRALYDETGEIADEDDVLSKNKDWDAYWRLLYEKLTVESIVKFENEFRHSEKEVSDVKESYIKYEGDMDLIMESVVCSRFEDEDRFREIIQKGIDDGSLPSFDAYVNETQQKKDNRKKKKPKRFHGAACVISVRYEAEREARESAKVAEETSKETKSLEEMILARRVNREKEMEGFFDHLAEKYSKPNSKKSKGVTKAKTAAGKGTKRKRK